MITRDHLNVLLGYGSHQIVTLNRMHEKRYNLINKVDGAQHRS